MQFAAICLDKDNAENLRLENRGAHLEHLKKIRGNLLLAGPFLNENGGMCGSLLVFNDIEESDIQNWLEDDPYNKAGLFQSVELKPFKKVL